MIWLKLDKAQRLSDMCQAHT